jgi:signal transduction histidine kinase
LLGQVTVSPQTETKLIRLQSARDFIKTGWINGLFSNKSISADKHYMEQNQLLEGYYDKIDQFNLQRTLLLSAIAFVLTLYVTIMDYLTLYSSHNALSLSIYRVLDPIYTGFALLINILARFARTYENKKLTRAVINIFIFGTIINYSMVSSIEQFDFKHHPSFVFALILMCVLMYIKPIKVVFLFCIGIALIFTFHQLIGIHEKPTEVSFSVSLFIGPIAFLCSWIQYKNNLRNFVDKDNLDKLNRDLEHQVNERTTELERANKELKIQIENQKKSEVELKMAIEKAAKSDRLKSAFLSNLSHEIRTPLNSIIGFSSLLNNPNLGEDKMKRYTGLITNCGKELVYIIDQLVEVSRIESGEIEVNRMYFHINELLHELQQHCIERLRDMKKEVITLMVNNKCHERNLRVYSDMVKVKHIIQNLLENAVKFTEKGKIEVGVEMASNHQLQFFVRDTGIGISNEHKEVLFDQFTQGESGMSRKYSGLGLGLSISKKYTELLGGKIWFESMEGKGSTFYFSLPV